MTSHQDAELERFKKEINIVEFAESLGYKLVGKPSKHSATMVSGGDKIVVATNVADGHGIYFSVHDDSDRGSVIDFAQKRSGQSLGHIRKELRGWVSEPARPAPKRRPADERPAKPAAIQRDRAALIARSLQLVPYAGTYLASRGLHDEVVRAFDVQQDARGNAVFVHSDEVGVTGWEAKNKVFTGFAEGGQRAFAWGRMRSEEPVHRLFVFEAAIDMLSYAQMHHADGDGALYASSGGAISDSQIEMLTSTLDELEGPELVLAMDADDAGRKMAEKVQAATANRRVSVVFPTTVKDWNDELQAKLAEESSRSDRVFASPSQA